MLSKAEALDLIHKHLDDTPRAAHSRFVAYAMRELASIFAANADLWEIAGLCSDLGFSDDETDAGENEQRADGEFELAIREPLEYVQAEPRAKQGCGNENEHLPVHLRRRRR